MPRYRVLLRFAARLTGIMILLAAAMELTGYVHAEYGSIVAVVTGIIAIASALLVTGDVAAAVTTEIETSNRHYRRTAKQLTLTRGLIKYPDGDRLVICRECGRDSDLQISYAGRGNSAPASITCPDCDITWDDPDITWDNTQHNL